MPAMPDQPTPTASRQARPAVLWLISDGKPGHRNQLEGLRAALARHTPLEAHWLETPAPATSLLHWLQGRMPAASALPDPRWIVVAGHRTHLAGLAARRARGGHLVVLMRPSLPLRLFDLCVIPEHDTAPARPNILRTRGVLNPMRPAEKIAGSAAILIGGESRHFAWDDARVLAAVEQLRVRWPDALVTDSRRTPTALRSRLATLGSAYHPWEACPPGWLATTLARTETCWITGDSVSMVYESLTAGCATGLIELPAQTRVTRVARGLEGLKTAGLVSTLDSLTATGEPPHPTHPALAEADRVARFLLGQEHA